MFAMEFTEEHVGTAETIPRRVLNEGLADTGEFVAKFWRDKILPKAFNARASSKRNYKPRTQHTKNRKKSDAAKGLALFGGQRDLVHSGVMMKTIADQKHSIRATPTQAVVTTHGPTYYTRQIADEVLRFIPDDETRMDQVGNERLGRFFNKVNHRKKFKVKG